MQAQNFQQDDETHWYSSDVGSFSFHFDETADVTSSRKSVSLSSSCDAAFTKTEVESEAPLSSLISERSIFLLIDAENIDSDLSNNAKTTEEEVKYLRRQVQNRWQTPNVKTTVTRMLFKQPVLLELFHSMSSKKQLLEEAVRVGDGDSILSVVLHLSVSLKKTLFYQLLKSHPTAVSQYACYLSTRMQIQELSDLFTMLGRNKDAAIKNFQYCCQNPSQQIHRLKNCISNHFFNSPDKNLIENYIKLLEWQKAKNSEELFRKSALETLVYSCKQHWNDDKTAASNPINLAKEFNLNERQFQWSALRARCSVKAWNDVENLLITKTWLGGIKMNTYLTMEEVIENLKVAGAPNEILVKHLNLINDVDTRIKLAASLQCEQLVIDSLTSNRDQKALIQQKTSSQSQSRIYSQADNVLRSFVSATKWKS